jgi:hypothetical protein
VTPERTVRYRAASDFGCGTSEVQVEQLGASTYVATGCGQSDQYTCGGRWVHGEGHVLECARDIASSASPGIAPSPAPPLALLEPPSGAGGFAFGASEDEERRVCEHAGHAYASQGDGRASCDGVATGVGAPARATLGYCAGKVCAVSLQVDLAPNENLSRALVRWKSALVERYGGPSASLASVPAQCVDDVTPCLLDRSGNIRFDWRWGSRQLISLGAEIDEAQHPSVSVAYVAPPASATRAPGL